MKKVVALLGRADQPTDAVEAYCQFLGEALAQHQLSLEIRRVHWQEQGWFRALRGLRDLAMNWQGCWVFVQYTALSWSFRGFSAGFLLVLRTLRRAGARVAVVYHDAEPYPACGWKEEIRRKVQLRTMRQSLQACDLAIFTIPLDKISWLRKPTDHAVFIPVGANLESPPDNSSGKKARWTTPAVSVFGVTGGVAGEKECAIITNAVQFAAREIGALRLLVFGRNADTAEAVLRRTLQSGPIELHVTGVVPAEELARLLGSSDVMLFVRGAISTRRGSAIAGIACGLPVVAWAGTETGGPICEAGVVFVSQGNTKEIGEALARILRDPEYRQSLAHRSREAQRRYFSWGAIANSYVIEMQRISGKSVNS